MSKVTSIESKKGRSAVDVMDDLNLKLGHIHALLDIMAECDKDNCDVNTAAYAIQHIVEDAKTLADELYHAPYGGAS